MDAGMGRWMEEWRDGQEDGQGGQRGGGFNWQTSSFTQDLALAPVETLPTPH